MQGQCSTPPPTGTPSIGVPLPIDHCVVVVDRTFLAWLAAPSATDVWLSNLHVNLEPVAAAGADMGAAATAPSLVQFSPQVCAPVLYAGVLEAPCCSMQRRMQWRQALCSSACKCAPSAALPCDAAREFVLCACQLGAGGCRGRRRWCGRDGAKPCAVQPASVLQARQTLRQDTAASAAANTAIDTAAKLR